MAHAVTADALGTPPPMTFEEFLAWAGEDTRAEWVAGKVVFLSPVSKTHGDLVGFLAILLGHFCEAHELGEVMGPQFLVRLSSRPSGRVPDLMFVAREHADRFTRTHLEGPPDLAVEVVSPDDPARDLVEKYGEYQQAGVREFWLIEPEKREATFFVLGADGHYQAAAPDAEGVYHSTAMPGLWLKVDWLWQEPMPKLMTVLKEWGLV